MMNGAGSATARWYHDAVEEAQVQLAHYERLQQWKGDTSARAEEMVREMGGSESRVDWIVKRGTALDVSSLRARAMRVVSVSLGVLSVEAAAISESASAAELSSLICRLDAVRNQLVGLKESA